MFVRKNLPVKNVIRPSLGIPDSLGLHTHLVLGSLITTTLWWETCHGSDSIISHVLPASVLYVPNVLQSGAMPLMMLLAKEEVEPPPLELVEIIYYIWSRPSRSCCCWRHDTPPLIPMPGEYPSSLLLSLSYHIIHLIPPQSSRPTLPAAIIIELICYCRRIVDGANCWHIDGYWHWHGRSLVYWRALAALDQF